MKKRNSAKTNTNFDNDSDRTTFFYSIGKKSVVDEIQLQNTKQTVSIKSWSCEFTKVVKEIVMDFQLKVEAERMPTLI